VTERVEHPIFARMFSALVASPLGRGMEKDRRRLLEGLSGRVIEVGAGSGANFAFYPAEVEEVVAVEPEPYFRAKAAQAAEDAPVKVTVMNGTASMLPVPNASFDAAVTSLVLCSVPSVEGALADLYRVLKPGGAFHFYEHVKAERGVLIGPMQRFVDATFWPRMTGNCHTSRDTVAAIEAAGFAIERLQRLELKMLGMPTPVTPHAVGVARKP
jgi:ubiquinone/menaquinone biosynthesis C-methylase UbiE